MSTPMFPLGMTVLPGMVVPLQVFEPRYVQLIRDLLADDTMTERGMQFGSVMIERGHEVGGDDVRSMVGTMVRIAELEAAPGDRYLLAVVGEARIRVERWLPDDPYPLADVAVWADEGSPPPDAAERVDSLRDRLAEIEELAAAQGLRIPGVGPMPIGTASVDPAIEVYRLAARAPIGPVDRHRVLAAPSLGERLDALGAALDDAMAVIEFRRT